MVNKIILVSRSQLEISDPKVEQRLINFDNLEETSADIFSGVQAAICCLGTTRAKAGKDGFVKVDHDYVLKSAQKLLEAGCKDFHLLTSYGSDPNSSMLYFQVSYL